MAAKNPQVNGFSTAGDSHSVVLQPMCASADWPQLVVQPMMTWDGLSGRLQLMKSHWKMRLLANPGL
jgi:hypothetical protein